MVSNLRLRSSTARTTRALAVAACAFGTLLATSTSEAVAFSNCQSPPATQPDHAATVIGYAYCLVLDREPDGAGLDGWRARLATGTTVERIIYEMLHSDEFARKNGVDTLSPAEHGALVHRRLLGRDPNAAISARLSAADSKEALDPVEDRLLNSEEFRQLHPALFTAVRNTPTLTALPEVKRTCDLKALKGPLEDERRQVIYSYCLVLGRWPDAYGLNTWREQMRGGLTVSALLSKLLQSAEFADKYRVAELGDDEFVVLVYRLLLGRDPDGQGRLAYASGLASGRVSRPAIFDSILVSDEFRTKQEAMFTARKLEPRRAEFHQPSNGPK
jgi:hypothetical protein